VVFWSGGRLESNFGNGWDESKWMQDSLKMNFSVGVNMYKEKVTYYGQDVINCAHRVVLLHIGISSSAAT
jgi:hypothetical protein